MPAAPHRKKARPSPSDRGRASSNRSSSCARPRSLLRSTAAAGLPGSGFRNFVIESWGELKKVDWPGQQQLIQGTAVVLIACLITGVYLFLADQVFKRFVQHVLLGG